MKLITYLFTHNQPTVVCRDFKIHTIGASCKNKLDNFIIHTVLLVIQFSKLKILYQRYNIINNYIAI